jgi:hypothetical protein
LTEINELDTLAKEVLDWPGASDDLLLATEAGELDPI